MNKHHQENIKKPYRLIIVAALFLSLAYLVGNIIYKNHLANAEQGSSKFDQNSKPKTVEIYPINKEDMNISVAALGTITSRNSVLVQSLVGGQLISVNFKEGDYVKKGQLLATIDPRPYQIQLSQAEAQLAKDKAILENAKLDLARYKHEYVNNATSKQVLDTQIALVKQNEATIKMDMAQVDNAKLQLSYCQINSPIDGLAGMRMTDPGNIIQQNGGSTLANGIVNIVQVNPITVLFSLPQDWLPRIREKAKDPSALLVEAFDKNNQTLLAAGKLLAINDVIDTATGTIQLKAVFENADLKLFPNQFVNVKLRIETVKDAIVAPLAAIQKGRKGDYVYVVDAQNKVHNRSIVVGETSGEKVMIQSGLSPGEMVVVDGADKLKENALVRPLTSKKNVGHDSEQSVTMSEQNDQPKTQTLGEGHSEGHLHHPSQEAH
jgi:membrane fusion protein, multidrug efflux system